MPQHPRDWLRHFQHAQRHVETAAALLGQGDRVEALKHIHDAKLDLGWCERQLRSDEEDFQHWWSDR